jgi:hypothetical protein
MTVVRSPPDSHRRWLTVEFLLYNPMPSGREGRSLRMPLRRGGICVSSRHSLEKRQVRPNIAARRLVAFSDGNPLGFRRISRLCQLGGVPEQPLHLWSVYLTVLFTRAFRQFPTRLVWPETEMVSELSALFSGAVHSLDSRPVPCDLLLLPRRVLQIVLGRSSGMCGE